MRYRCFERGAVGCCCKRDAESHCDTNTDACADTDTDTNTRSNSHSDGNTDSAAYASQNTAWTTYAASARDTRWKAPSRSINVEKPYVFLVAVLVHQRIAECFRFLGTDAERKGADGGASFALLFFSEQRPRE